MEFELRRLPPQSKTMDYAMDFPARWAGQQEGLGKVVYVLFTS